MKNLNATQLIDAPHIQPNGVLEVDAVWQNSDRVALLCHPNPKAGGTMTNKVITTMYRFCRDSGMSVVRFNYRGVGRSSGMIEYGEGEFLDTLCVLSWILTQSPATKLWLGGFSFGGFIACRVADILWKSSQFNIELQKLTLIAPSIEKNDPTGLRLNPEKTYMIYGDKDEFVSVQSMTAFANGLGIDYHVIPQTSHFFHGQLSQLKDALKH